MNVHTVKPIFRIFDNQKAIEFYIEWLGLKIDWEHRFEENTPVYMQVSGYGLVLHLSEHHGDGTPGSQFHANCTGLKAFHEMLTEKEYKYGRPGFERSFYDTWSVTVHDPFGNRIIFDEEIK